MWFSVSCCHGLGGCEATEDDIAVVQVMLLVRKWLVLSCSSLSSRCRDLENEAIKADYKVTVVITS